MDLGASVPERLSIVDPRAIVGKAAIVDRSATEAERLAVVTMDAPLVRAGDVVSIASPSVAWAPRHHDLRVGTTGDDDEWAVIGWGIAARVKGSGPDRFAQVRASAEALWSRLAPVAASDLPFAPRLFGGFAFDAMSVRDDRALSRSGDGDGSRQGVPPQTLADAWSDFGDATFVLPELIYAYSIHRACLAAFVPEGSEAAARGKLESLRSALSSLAESPASTTGTVPVRSSAVLSGGSPSAGSVSPRFPPAASRPEPTPQSRSSRAPTTGALPGSKTGSLDSAAPGAAASAKGGGLEAKELAYVDIVARAVRAIESGQMDKVVLCRTSRIHVTEGAATRAFSFLDDKHTSAARFLVALGDRQFVGASPERLAFVRGRRVVTEALAGSLPRKPGDAEGDARAELLASEKDRAEHAFVVAAIRESLAPICEAISAPETPVVRSLPNVHHLATPIAGLLEAHAHALDVAARLHPTPALCGSPRGAARDFLIAHEAEPRGWYGGAVGWFDRAGDGAFHVAIRSALVTSREAFLYAGAGIVRASDPSLELVETIAKERAMREALEAPPRSSDHVDPSPEAA